MIDYVEAKKRILLAFCRGVLKKYGSRRYETEEIEVERPGPLYWAKDERWTDPEGVERRGRMLRKPSRKVKTEVQVPRGVVGSEILDYADAVAEAYLEVLRIAEETFEGRAEGFLAELHRDKEAP